MNVNKIAAQDAAKWARAEMFFGEGAGTRRKLLAAEIATKVERLSGYNEAFNKAYKKQNFADHAIKAAKERKSLDRSKFVKRNVRGVLTGNKRSLTNAVLIASSVYFVAHQIGLDEDIKREAKLRYNKTKSWIDREMQAAKTRAQDKRDTTR